LKRTAKPSYEKLEKRIEYLESGLAKYKENKTETRLREYLRTLKGLLTDRWMLSMSITSPPVVFFSLTNWVPSLTRLKEKAKTHLLLRVSCSMSVQRTGMKSERPQPIL